MQKGFSALILLLGTLVLIGVGGGAFYLVKTAPQNSFLPQQGEEKSGSTKNVNQGAGSSTSAGKLVDVSSIPKATPDLSATPRAVPIGLPISEEEYRRLKEQAGKDTLPNNETANWKTYTNVQNGFLLKYPSSWVYKEGAEGPEFAPSNNLLSVPNSEVFSPISIFIKSTDNFDLSSLSLNQYEEQPTIISGINTSRITGIHKATNERATGLKFTHNGKIFVIVTFGDNYVQIFDQILSTFKFLD